MEFGPVAPRKVPSQDLEVLALQMDQWVRSRQGMINWAEMAMECVNFAEGRQYSPADIQALAQAKIPSLQLNKIAPLVRLMYGFYRANRYDIRYLPGSDGTGSDDVADALTALSKHIDTDNRTKWIDAEVFDDGLVTGRGYCDVRLDFSKNILGEVRERALDPFSVYPDPEGDTVDTETWNHVHLRRWMSLDDIKILYGPDAEKDITALQGNDLAVTNLEATGAPGDDITPPRFFAGWDPFNQPMGTIQLGTINLPLEDMVNRHRKLISVIETQHRKLKKVKRFIDLTTGMIRIVPDHWKQDRIEQVLQWANAHQEQIILDDSAWVKSIRFTVSAGNQILYDDWSPYRSFTIIPFFAQFRRGMTRGMVNDLIDPQREVNKRRSAMLHVLITAANSGWTFEENSLTEESKAALQTAGGAPGLILEHKQGSQAPQKIEPSAVPQGFVQAEQMATNDLHEIAGINPDALGSNDKVMSGRAVEARQRSAYVGAELWFDNFARYQEQKGRMRLGIVQDYYTEQRLFRVPNDSGDDQQILINWQNASGEIVNDINSGSFHTTVDTAPISATFMQGAMEEAIELHGLGIQIPPDIMLDMSSIPMKRRIIDEMKNQPPAPPPPEQLLAQAAMTKANNEMPIAQLNAQTKQQVAAASNQTVEDIADKRIALETSLEQMQAQSRFDLQHQKVLLEQQGEQQQTGPTNAIPGANIPHELQRNADTAFYGGNINASTTALQALDKIVAPLPPGAQARVGIQALPRTT